MTKPNMESFREAFGNDTSSTWAFCDCGAEFGEEDPGHIVTQWYGVISFEGKEYVADCGCWHKRAEQIMGFIDTHKHKIARYLKAEKERLTQFAEDHPTVE